MKHTPKGSMCVACVHSKRNCSTLAFDKMPVIEKYNDLTIVRCAEFSRKAAQADIQLSVPTKLLFSLEKNSDG